MKLNFWQILGLILLIVAVVLMFRRRTATDDTKVGPVESGTTTVTTIPTTR